MAPNRPQKEEPKDAHWEFMAVVRKFDTEEKFENQALPELYATHGTFQHTRHDVYPTEYYDEALEQLKKQRGMGVMIDHAWSAQAGQVACLAQYCGFRDARELTAYVDMIG
jgi:hypothetical protein